MNNKTASNIRENGMNYIFNNVINSNELIRIDSGKFVFPVIMENGDKFYCEIDFIAKKEDYSPDYDISKYNDKIERMKKAEKELTERKQKKAEKSAKKSE